MAKVVGVVFQPGGKVYSFDPAGLELRWDERVICQTSRGREYGRIVQTEHEVPDEELTGPLKRVVRRAGPADTGVAVSAARPGVVRPIAIPRALEQVLETATPHAETGSKSAERDALDLGARAAGKLPRRRPATRSRRSGRR